MPKILFFVPGSIFAGTEKIMLSIMKLLRDNDYEIKCIINGWKDGVFQEKLEKKNIENSSIKLGFIHFRKPFWTLDTILHYIPAIKKTKQIIKAFKPDYLYFSNHKWVFMLIPVFNNQKIILHIHDYIYPTATNRLMFKTIQKQDIKIIAVSNFIKHNLMNSGVQEKDITVIPNFIEIEKDDRIVKEEADSKTFKIGIIGQIIPRKGHDVLIEAFQLLSLQHPDIELNIAGTGDRNFISRLKKSILDYSLEDKVTWHGFINSPALFYQSMNVIVVPTKGPEPFGLVAIEPMAYYIPVIVSDTGGLSEIIKQRVNGLKFKNNSALELKNCIEELIQNPKHCQSLVKNAQHSLTECYSTTTFLELFNNKILENEKH